MMRRAALCLLALAAGAGAAEQELPLARPFEMSDDYATGDRFMGIRLLGTLTLTPERKDGYDLVELSGLAWDDDDGLLYALSDHGRVFHLRPVLTGGVLTGVQLLRAVALRGRSGKPLRGWSADAEGLTLAGGRNGVPGDARLIVSFEVEPRILAFRPDGQLIERFPLPEALQGVARYAGRNKALESVTLHPRLGLLTAPEWPLRDGDRETVRIFSLRGPAFRFPRHRSPMSAVVALEALPDGSLLTLERSFSGVLSPLIITLRRVPPLAGHDPGAPLVPELVARFDSSEGWSIDNFEGLTRHRGRRFFMVSDDNQNFYQATLLVYFEIPGLP